MKAVVIYYSQTGNTEKIAYAIQTGVKQITGHCDILKIKEANPRRLYEYDLIGLGAPVHGGWIEPANVAAFIKDMRFVGGKHCFAFATHCTLPYHFFPSIVPKLKARGLIVIGTGDWYGAGHGAGHEYPYLTDGHPDEIDLKEAEEFGREMVCRSGMISAGETNLIPEVPVANVPESIPDPILKSGKSPRPSYRREDYMKFEKGKCAYPACRLCMENCPSDGIDLTLEPPVLWQPCQHCGFCEEICPTGAINFDALRELTEQNQEISARRKEAGLAALKVAEAEGRFRRLVPEEEVGWDTPVYKVFNKHPRWIIGKGRP